MCECESDGGRFQVNRAGHKSVRTPLSPNPQRATSVTACIGAARNEARAVDSRSASAGAANWPKSWGTDYV